MAAEYVVADSSVMSYLTKASRHSRDYQDLIGQRRLAVSFQTKAELLASDFGEKRRERVRDLLAAILLLPHSEATSVWYSRVIPISKERKRLGWPGGDAGQADIWIIASALEYSLPLVSHDAGQVDLGRVMGLKVLTSLPDYRKDNPTL